MALADFFDVSKGFTIHPERRMGHNLEFELPVGSKNLPTDTYVFRPVHSMAPWYLVKLNHKGYNYLNTVERPFDYVTWLPPPQPHLPNVDGIPLNHVSKNLNALSDGLIQRGGRGGNGTRIEGEMVVNKGDYYNFYMSGYDIWRIEQEEYPSVAFINWVNENPLEVK